MNDKTKSIGWRLVGAMFAPFVLFSTYLVFSRWLYRIESDVTYLFALIISSLAGAAFILLLPVRRSLRAFLVVVYVPLSGVTLFFYSLFFVGIVFGDWI